MHMASASDNSSLLIDNFIDLIWLEKGLSTNTLSAYRQDLTSFNKWLGETSIKSATKANLLDYLSFRLKDFRPPLIDFLKPRLFRE